MPKTKELQLTAEVAIGSPISVGKGDNAITYDVIKLREPTWGEWLKAQEESHPSRVSYMLTLQVAAVPPRVLDAMSVREMQECDRFFAQFFGDGAT